MTTAISLKLRALFESAVRQAGLRAEPGRRVSGLSTAAQGLFLAAAAESAPRDLHVLITPTDRDIDGIIADAQFFLASLEGLSETDLARTVLPFPSDEVDPYRDLAPHFDVASTRARALHAAAAGGARIIVASATAILPRLSRPERLLGSALTLRRGDEVATHVLAELLSDAGFTREDPVDEHGSFCVRGGVVDFFPAGEAHPVRIEFIGDEIESIRRYDAKTQRSIAALDHVSVTPLREHFEAAAPDFDSATETDADRTLPPHRPTLDRAATFFDYAAHTTTVRYYVSEEDSVRTRALAYVEQVEASYEDRRSTRPDALPPHEILSTWALVDDKLRDAVRLDLLGVDDPVEDGEPAADADAPDVDAPQGGAWITPHHVHVQCQPAIERHGRINEWITDVRRARERGEVVLFIAGAAGRAERVVELLAEYEVVALPIDRAEDTTMAAVLVAVGQISRGFRLPAARFQIVAEADVFEEERRAHERRRSVAKTFMSDFRDLRIGDQVVHADHGIGEFVGLRQMQVGRDAQEFMELRYAGDAKLFLPVERLDLIQKYRGAGRPALDRLGGTTWEKAKTRVRKAMRDMAEELLKLYAARRTVVGHAFTPDTHWQTEFEDAFEYELTPDQQTANDDIKRDMEAPTPMDRLLCGDVGYGKTEVAMRAAFKSVMDGKQVAFLAPTTVLALQHLKTLRSRFAAFPVSIEMVSRFRTKGEQKQILTDLEAGRLDVIIGTHRLLSKDVQFKDLGLLIVDEEQRFGVAHKERIKQMRRKIDVLTLTATPIPRTLNMSLVGIRDMSVIETPPKDRQAIQTSVVKFDTNVIARALRNEIARGGQVYVVHNRVESIYSLANMITRLAPDARVGVGHGQMTEDSLERVMVDFVDRKIDVLVATTIIENGLDIPNANTIVINRADRYGLSQLYQLRGRVGRSGRRAYAYLLIPPGDALSDVAKKRLAAIREFSDLGSGFRIAALDLEIRGAGALLGGQQSGHIEAIGFDMYMKLLEQTVREMKGEEIEDEGRAAVNLRVDLRIGDDYIADMNQRLTVYRRMASARSEDELRSLIDELRDRYGPPPAAVLNLADYGQIRVMADRLKIESLDREGDVVVIKVRSDAPIDPIRLAGLVQRRGDVTLTPPASLRLSLKGPASPRRASSSGPRGETAVSWWTARATAGAVTGGFTKDEILKTPAEDPRANRGLFDRLGGLLQDLTGITSL